MIINHKPQLVRATLHSALYPRYRMIDAIQYPVLGAQKPILGSLFNVTSPCEI